MGMWRPERAGRITTEISSPWLERRRVFYGSDYLRMPETECDVAGLAFDHVSKTTDGDETAAIGVSDKRSAQSVQRPIPRAGIILWAYAAHRQ